MKPIGVTVVSRSYRGVGSEAIRRFKRFTGLDVVKIECDDQDGFEEKLKLDIYCGKRPVIFFDADWWLLRPVDFTNYFNTPQFFAVNDPGIHHEHFIPYRDCQENGLNAQLYVNTGFFLCDLRDVTMRHVFQRARKSFGNVRTYDHTDQFHINKALLELGVAQQMLPLSFNFFLFAAEEGCCQIPRQIIGLHAAGLPAKEKLSELKLQAKVFGRKMQPMWRSAVDSAYSVNYEL